MTSRACLAVSAFTPVTPSQDGPAHASKSWASVRSANSRAHCMTMRESANRKGLRQRSPEHFGGWHMPCGVCRTVGVIATGHVVVS